MPYGLLGNPSPVPMVDPFSSWFDPRGISGLVCWYDANASRSITISTGVSAWANLEGTSSRDLQQTTANNQPIVVNNFNGRSAIEFNGTTHFLQRAFSYARPCHEFVVARFTATGRNQGITDGSDFATKLLWHNSTNFIVYQGLNGQISDAYQNMRPFVIDSEFANATSIGRLNGSKFASGDGNAGTGVPVGMTVGKWGGGQSFYGAIAVAEIILYGRRLSSDEAARVRLYLSRKYAVSVA